MKAALAILLGWMLLVPVSASALNPGECSRLLKQIHHLNTMRDQARARNNDMWEDRMVYQTDLLRDRFDARCEGFADDDRSMRIAIQTLANVMKIGAEAAARFFTMGAF
jgi:hypothetical protein